MGGRQDETRRVETLLAWHQHESTNTTKEFQNKLVCRSADGFNTLAPKCVSTLWMVDWLNYKSETSDYLSQAIIDSIKSKTTSTACSDSRQRPCRAYEYLSDTQSVSVDRHEEKTDYSSRLIARRLHWQPVSASVRVCVCVRVSIYLINSPASDDDDDWLSRILILSVRTK